MSENILVPVDGSSTMERTIQYACNLAKMLGGTISLLHVVTMPYPIMDSIFDPTPLEDWGKRTLETAKQMADKCGSKAETILENGFGNAGHTIVKVSRENDFTLIIIHARGHSKVESILLGSVCHAVAHEAHCPVMILRP